MLCRSTPYLTRLPLPIRPRRRRCRTRRLPGSCPERQSCRPRRHRHLPSRRSRLRRAWSSRLPGPSRRLRRHRRCPENVRRHRLRPNRPSRRSPHRPSPNCWRQPQRRPSRLLPGVPPVPDWPGVLPLTPLVPLVPVFTTLAMFRPRTLLWVWSTDPSPHAHTAERSTDLYWSADAKINVPQLAIVNRSLDNFPGRLSRAIS